MTKEHKFSDRIKEILLDLKKTETWGSAEMLARKPVWHADLGLSHKCYLTAIAFDAIYNDLSGSERKTAKFGRLAIGADSHPFPQLNGTQLVDILCLYGRHLGSQFAE